MPWEQDTVLAPSGVVAEPRPLAALDLEGDGGERGFMSAALCLPNEQYYATDPDLLVARLSAHDMRGVHVYAHNLTYDFGMLMQHVPMNFKAYLLKGRVYKVTLNLGGRNGVYLHDSLGLFAGLPLAQLGQEIGLPKLDTPPDLLSDPSLSRPWTCSLHGREYCLECYNVQDARITLLAVQELQAWLNGLGVSLGNTLASTALALYRAKYLDEEYLTPFPERNEFARQAYYGGRV